MPRQSRLPLNYPAEPVRKLNPQQEWAAVQQWNATWDVGIFVTWEDEYGAIRAGRTRSQAWMHGRDEEKGWPGIAALIRLEGVEKAIPLSRVKPSGHAVPKQEVNA